MHVGSNKNSVLLQKGQAFVSRPDNQEVEMYAQVMFDSCSQIEILYNQQDAGPVKLTYCW